MRVGRERAAIGHMHRGKSSLHPGMRVGISTGRDPELWNRNDTAAGTGMKGKDHRATGEPTRTTPADSVERRIFAGASRNEARESRTRPGYGAQLNAASRPRATAGGEQKEAYSSHPAHLGDARVDSTGIFIIAILLIPTGVALDQTSSPGSRRCVPVHKAGAQLRLRTVEKISQAQFVKARGSATSFRRDGAQVVGSSGLNTSVALGAHTPAPSTSSSGENLRRWPS